MRTHQRGDIRNDVDQADAFTSVRQKYQVRAGGLFREEPERSSLTDKFFMHGHVGGEVAGIRSFNGDAFFLRCCAFHDNVHTNLSCLLRLSLA